MSNFDDSKISDSSYCITWALSEGARKGAAVRSRTLPNGEKAFVVRDLMFVFGDYMSRDVAALEWKSLISQLPQVRNKFVTLPAYRNQDFCTMTVFLDLILPHVVGKIASRLSQLRRNVAREPVTPNDDELDETMDSGRPDSADSEMDDVDRTDVVATVGNGFEMNRAGDLVYCMEWAKKEAARKGVVVYQTTHLGKMGVFGVIGLMFLFGSYANRGIAARQWRKLKSRTGDRPNGPNSEVFCVPVEVRGKLMDHCTIPDFFDKVLPHITGPVADAIKRARSTSATLMSTGSQMAVDQTRANAVSVMNAGTDVQMTVEDVRERVEQSAIDDGIIPVEVMSSRGLAESGESPPKYKVIYKDVPPGPKLYRRVSQQRYDPAIDVPPSSKLQPGEVKIGINRTNLNQRNSGYADDYGLFDRVITTRSDREVEQMERVVKGAIHPYTTQNSSEYFNPERLLQSKKLDSGECDPTDRAWKYCYDALMMTEMNSINGVYDAEVVFDDTCSEQTRDGVNNNQQSRLDDYFTTGGQSNRTVQSQDRPARTITVRFKRIDGCEKEVEMRENSQNIDMRRMELEIKADFEIEKYKIQTDADLELKKTVLDMFKNDTKNLVDFWKVMMNSS